MWTHAIFASLALHLLLWFTLDQLPTGRYEEPPLEVSIHTQPIHQISPEKEHQNLVLKSKVPLSQLTDTGKARFLSEDRIRVKEEMQARLSGITENKAKEDSLQKNSESKQIPQNLNPIPKPLFPDPDDRSESLAQKNSGKSRYLDYRELGSSASRANERINNVKFGDFSALNTDQYLYYSFYARIAPLIRYHWERNVEEALSEIARRGQAVPTRTEWTTVIDVSLDPKGYFVSSLIENSSSLAAFDLAVSQAFRSATPFLNPPTEMVQDDRRIHLKYAFTVYWDPRRGFPNF